MSARFAATQASAYATEARDGRLAAGRETLRGAHNSEASEEVARLAEQAADAAESAARSARDAASRAATFAADTRAHRLHDAPSAAGHARAEEGAARDRYHEAEREARERHSRGDSASGAERPNTRGKLRRRDGVIEKGGTVYSPAVPSSMT